MDKLILLLLGCTLLITSCATQDKTPHSEKFVTIDGSTINIYYGVGKPGYELQKPTPSQDNLRVITRGHTAGKVAINSTLGVILCNPFSLLHCNWTDLGFSKEELEGSITKIPNISHSYAYPKYIEAIKQNIRFSTTQDYSPTPIYFYVKPNYLVYDDQYFKLKVGFEIYLNHSRVDGAFKCEEEKTGITYEEWIANDYTLAINEGKKLIDKCFQRLDKNHFEHLRNLMEQKRKEFL
ncbi:hypothetical protein L5B97_07950 [Avibacterium sp. 20-15]|uniref:hypothetical protein n=1 Tax=unclassified Avibacterium TaxID=2685287 RepID=UPI002026DA2C|nr:MULTISPECIES: hypothetical protein [unclassified Avibacterium]MCW9733401.1 hypothetical protein [Avibacterium sp. 20-15]URL01610.1 hypothetical protein L4F91_08805 [Avibacterium sp. 20-126]URL03273.1 hypothetical protein L4F93_06640 [Avibacterium sp. 20-132]